MPEGKRWLWWRKTKNPEGTALVDFVTFISITCYQWHSVDQLFLKVMDQKTLVKCRWSYNVRITQCLYKHLKSLPDTSSKICPPPPLDWKQFPTLFLSLWRNKTQSLKRKTSKSTASLSLAERWTISENSPTIKFSADLVLAHRCLSIKFKKKTRTRELELIKPLISKAYLPTNKMNCM